jgi:hypothetical protein
MRKLDRDTKVIGLMIPLLIIGCGILPFLCLIISNQFR